ncbi:Uncharacterised protein [Collinsella aerofaciens]|nr:Uncharacterised protein [Collinsella aerofaciens]
MHSTRTQHFLSGDRFGIIREVDIEYDPVIKDVDRVDRRRTQAAPPRGPHAGTRTRPSRLLRPSRNCPHQCSQSSPPRAAVRTTPRWRASSACSRGSSGTAGTGRAGPRPLHRGARGLDRPLQYGEARRCARRPHAGRVPRRAGKGRVTVQEIVRSSHSCPFGTASCWGVPAPNPARNEYSKLEFSN